MSRPEERDRGRMTGYHDGARIDLRSSVFSRTDNGPLQDTDRASVARRFAGYLAFGPSSAPTPPVSAYFAFWSNASGQIHLLLYHHSERFLRSMSCRIIGVKMSCIANGILPPGHTMVLALDM